MRSLVQYLRTATLQFPSSRSKAAMKTLFVLFLVLNVAFVYSAPLLDNNDLTSDLQLEDVAFDRMEDCLKIAGMDREKCLKMKKLGPLRFGK
uniref:Secreted protein n=1 Tax=Steinernema glaseri TaxID=37863 RepID=A0A1I7ZW91_9BILA